MIRIMCADRQGARPTRRPLQMQTQANVQADKSASRAPLRHAVAAAVRSTGRVLARLVGWMPREAALPAFLPTEPAPPPEPPIGRSVPVPVAALTQLLNQYPSARSRMRHLALVESSCYLSPDEPFSRLPPRAVEIAIQQLDTVLAYYPGLTVLRLQLERRLQTHRARVGAVLADEDRRWRLDAAGESTFGSTDWQGGLGPAFAETMPLDRPERAHAARDPVAQP